MYVCVCIHTHTRPLLLCNVGARRRRFREADRVGFHHRPQAAGGVARGRRRRGGAAAGADQARQPGEGPRDQADGGRVLGQYGRASNHAPRCRGDGDTFISLSPPLSLSLSIYLSLSLSIYIYIHDLSNIWTYPQPRSTPSERW